MSRKNALGRRSLLKALVTGAAGATLLSREASASGYFNLGAFWRQAYDPKYILADAANVNLFELANSPTTAVDLVFEVIPGVTLSSTSADVPALVTGVFPAGSTIKLINRGRIIGAGGNGASIVSVADKPVQLPPTDGGTAIGLNYPLTVDNSGGFILGGGGGGGLGGGGGFLCLAGGGAGGGGAGQAGGKGGPETMLGGGAGSDGSTVGGQGGAGYSGGAGMEGGGTGGAGGNYGQPGKRGAAGRLPDGTPSCEAPDVVGAAGAAIRTNGHALEILGELEQPSVQGPII